MSDDALPLCACVQYYDSHHPECPARRAYEALASRLGAVEDDLRHSVSVISSVRSWLMENERGSTHWENCEREHATCRAISQLGDVVERLSRLNLTE